MLQNLLNTPSTEESLVPKVRYDTQLEDSVGLVQPNNGDFEIFAFSWRSFRSGFFRILLDFPGFWSARSSSGSGSGSKWAQNLGKTFPDQIPSKKTGNKGLKRALRAHLLEHPFYNWSPNFTIWCCGCHFKWAVRAILWWGKFFLTIDCYSKMSKFSKNGKKNFPKFFLHYNLTCWLIEHQLSRS